MTRSVRLALFLAGVSLGSAALGLATVAPNRTTLAPSRVTALAFSGSSVAYATAATARDCFHVELWRPATKRTWRLGTRRPCSDVPSTGFGISDLAVATRRAVWVSYAGGNLRDWELWTATTTRPAPRRLRLVGVPVDEPAPIVVGAGTPGAIPYAVGAELTFLADNGRARFRRTMASPIRRLASGIGPHRVRVGALLADGSLWRVLTDGKVVDTARVYAPSTVRALRVGPPGIGVQVGATVEIDRPGALLVVALPPGALMVDLTASAVLVERAGSLLLVPLSGASATVLVKGSRAQPVQGQIESNGLAWSRGSRLFFRA